MKQELKYGNDSISSELPPEYSWKILEGAKNPSPDENEVISAGIDELCNHLKQEGIKKNSRILLIIPDRTRRCRLEILLPPLMNMLREEFTAGCSCLAANGSHALQNEDTVREMVGERIYQDIPIHQHDSCDKKNLIEYGTTKRGTPVLLNRRLKKADLIITVGGVLFHYFAGFGGGPKMIFPGVAGYESIRANHALSLDFGKGDFREGCREGELDANPLYQDLAEAASMVSPVISWQLLLDREGRIHKTACGSLLPAHRQIAAEAARLYSIPLSERADLVLASAGGFPADVNLIQSHKAIHHAFAAVRPGGWMIILAECRQGIGSETFLDYFREKDSRGIADRLRTDYKLNGQTALALRKKTEACRIILVSKLDPDIVRSTGMIPAADLDSAWRIVRQQPGNSIHTAYLFPQASLYVPKCAN